MIMVYFITQFNGAERDKLGKDLEVLTSENNHSDSEFNSSLCSALTILGNAQPDREDRLSWYSEINSIYGLIGKSIKDRLSKRNPV